MRKLKLNRSFKAGAFICIYHVAINPTYAQNPTPVLDGYAYELFDDVEIDLTNQTINIDSNMFNCEQPNGDLPIDTKPFALNTNNQFIGLKGFYYNVAQNNIYFNSETSNLLCDNGVYVDTLFYGSFE